MLIEPAGVGGEAAVGFGGAVSEMGEREARSAAQARMAQVVRLCARGAGEP
jgi:hypothetical protein